MNRMGSQYSKRLEESDWNRVIIGEIELVFLVSRDVIGLGPRVVNGSVFLRVKHHT